MNFVLKLSIIGVVVCVHLLLLNGSYGQTSQIEMGTLNFPVIYNRTINIPAEQRPWYNRLFGWFSRSPAPIQNVTYTFPPSSNQVSYSSDLNDEISVFLMTHLFWHKSRWIQIVRLPV